MPLYIIDMMELQKYIKEHPNWEKELTEAPYFLKVRKDKELRLVLFSYNQIASDMSLTICREARGVVLDIDTQAVRVRGFDKFFNAHESGADPMVKIGGLRTIVQEKVDGSIIKVAALDPRKAITKDNVLISSNGTIDAYEAPLPLIEKGGPTSFGQLTYELLVKSLGPDFELDEEYTYIFELVGPHNRVVVPYKEDGLVLLGLRHNKLGLEISPALHPNVMPSNVKNAFPVPATYTFHTKEELEKTLADLSWTEEGYVVVTEDAARPGELHRIKIKGEAYLRAHRLRGETYPTPKRIVDLIQNDNLDDFLGYFPEYSGMVEDIRADIRNFVEKAAAKIEEGRHILRNFDVNRKTYATEFVQKQSEGVPHDLLYQLISNWGKSQWWEETAATEVASMYLKDLPSQKVVEMLEIS